MRIIGKLFKRDGTTYSVGDIMLTRTPLVTNAREFLEITRDFTDSKDVVREAISNAIDWKAAKIWVKVTQDSTRPDEELIIEIKDNGIGLNEERLEAFFDLEGQLNVILDPKKQFKVK